VKSIFNAFGRKDCIRIRIGVGHPKLQKTGSQKNITGHVLGSFSQDEVKTVNSVIDTACNASLHIIENGVTSAMNLFNTN
jgi:PTH1 family peptidyl-tRNA hydrolase